MSVHPFNRSCYGRFTYGQEFHMSVFSMMPEVVSEQQQKKQRYALRDCMRIYYQLS
jgi:hypothetical protein